MTAKAKIRGMTPSSAAPHTGLWNRSSLWIRLAWFEPFWIGLLAPSLLFPDRFWTIAWHPYLALALFLFWPVRRLAYGRFSVRTPVDWSVGLLLLWIPVSLWISVDRAQSWEAAGYLLVGVALFFALINWPPARHRPQLIAWLVGAIGAGLVLMGGPLIRNVTRPMQFLGMDPTHSSLSAQVGETINPNIWAGGLLMILPLYLALAITPSWSRRGWMRLLPGLLSALGVGALLLAESRGAYLSLAVAVAVLILLRWPRSLYLILALATGILIWLAMGGVQPLLTYVMTDPNLYGWSGRPEIWLRAYSAIQDFPWTGVGMGLYARAIPVLYPYFSMDYSIFTRDYNIPHAHNLFLQIGVDMGAPGVVAYLALLMGAFIMLVRPLRRPHQRRQRTQKQLSEDVRDGREPAAVTHSSSQRRDALHWALAAGVTAGLIAMIVHGLVDAVAWGTKLAFIPWLLYAQAVTIRLRPRRRRRRRSADGS